MAPVVSRQGCIVTMTNSRNHLCTRFYTYDTKNRRYHRQNKIQSLIYKDAAAAFCSYLFSDEANTDVLLG